MASGSKSPPALELNFDDLPDADLLTASELQEISEDQLVEELSVENLNEESQEQPLNVPTLVKKPIAVLTLSTDRAKARFHQSTAEERDQIASETVAKTTKDQTRWAISTFKGRKLH